MTTDDQPWLPGVRGEFQVTRDAVAKRQKRPAQVELPVQTIKPNQRLYELALDQAGGDWRRIEIQSPTKLVVHNKPVR